MSTISYFCLVISFYKSTSVNHLCYQPLTTACILMAELNHNAPNASIKKKIVHRHERFKSED